jgi:hypothetical protein
MDTRQAGTEVGNPEIVVAASFRILPSDSDWVVEGFEAKCMGVDYTTQAGDSGSIWVQEEGYWVDFMLEGSGPPPMTFVGEEWDAAGLWVKFAPGSDSLPDLLDWKDLTDPHWLKVRRRSDDRRIVFALPDSLQLRLGFEQNRLNGFRSRDSLRLDVAFDLGLWLTHNSEWALEQRQGPDGVVYSVVSPRVNDEVYRRLEASFSECFLADKVSGAVP